MMMIRDNEFGGGSDKDGLVGAEVELELPEAGPG